MTYITAVEAVQMISTHKKIKKQDASDELVQALLDEELKFQVFGKKEGSTSGELHSVPIDFLRRDDFDFDLKRNAFFCSSASLGLPWRIKLAHETDWVGLKVKRKDVERLFILQSPCTSGQEKQILGTPISDAEILAAVEKANQKRGATLEDSVPELYKLAMPFYHSYIEKYRKEPTKKTIAKFLFDKHNTQNWNHTSIERLMNAHEIKLQYQEYKKTK